MKLLHLADLHFGKSLHNQPLLEDQRDWIEKALERIRLEKPSAVLIAGDVYDRGVPGKEAVNLLSDFLTELSKEGIEIMLTAGNHDGGERLEFASDILANQHVHIAGTVRAEILHVSMKDEYGPVTFWLMPYTTPAAVRVALQLGEDEVIGYRSAVERLLSRQCLDTSQRNVLIAHQTVLNGDREPVHSSSETAIGGVGGVDFEVFRDFDYVALGHIHGAQSVGRESIRYAGAPLCYHFSEAGQKKGLLWVQLGAKGEELSLRTEEIPPLHKVRKTISGKYNEILLAERENPVPNAYVRVELTDDHLPPHAKEELDALFSSCKSSLLDLTRVQRRPRMESTGPDLSPEKVSLLNYFCDFYRQRSADLSDPSPYEMDLIQSLAEKVENRGDETLDEVAEALVEEALRGAKAREGEA